MDLRLVLRSLGRRPGYSALVILTLGLGIGAATAIFTVVNAVLLKPLPYHEANRLALIWSRWNNFDKTWVSEAEYLDYQRQHQVFQDVGLWASNGEVTITGPEGPAESVESAQSTANLLGVLGVAPLRGRMFSPEEDVPNGPPLVMVGHDLWQRRWGGDPALVGRTIVLDGQPYRVAGILPRDFRLPLEFQSRATVQLLGSLEIDRAAAPRGSHCCYAVARLNPQVTADQASREVHALATQWIEQGLYPRDMSFAPFVVSLDDEVSGPVRPALALLAVAVGLLVMLTCANVTNLILARVESRGREAAVRAAMGAGVMDLVRLVLEESLVLSLAGGVLGLGMAWAGLRALVVRAPTTVPRLAELGIDGGVAFFALALAVGTGLAVALAPVLRLGRFDPAGVLREGRGQSGAMSRRDVRKALVVAETSLAVILLVGAGLTVKSFIKLRAIDAGFDARRVLTLHLTLPAATYPTVESAIGLFGALGDQVRRLPGVEAAGLVRLLPLETEMGDAGLRIQDKPIAPGLPGRQADWQAVTPGYFEAMRIPLLSGRYFDAHDDLNGEQVIIVNRELAREYFPGEDPVGRMIQVGPDSTPWRRVVGVVGDVHHNGLLGDFKRGWYIPQDQWSRSYGNPRRSAYLVVRAAGDPGKLVAPVLAVAHRLDPNLPATDIRQLSDVLAAATKEQRFTMSLMAIFACLALSLAAVGIYGVMSYAVGQRTREIGIRLALGSEIGEVRWLVVKEGMRPAYWGALLGLLVAAGFSRFLRSVLYGVAPLDGAIFLLVPFALLTVAVAAALIPAIRASRVAPVEALRSD